MPILFKDGVQENTHPLNVSWRPPKTRCDAHEVDRIPLYEVYMRMAEELAKRSTCSRLQVGTVITDGALEHVVALGYNGNARGFPNRCDIRDSRGLRVHPLRAERGGQSRWPSAEEGGVRHRQPLCHVCEAPDPGQRHPRVLQGAVPEAGRIGGPGGGWGEDDPLRPMEGRLALTRETRHAWRIVPQAVVPLRCPIPGSPRISSESP